jgi:hypothetical protein
MKWRISLNMTGLRSLTSNWWVKFYLFCFALITVAEWFFIEIRLYRRLSS